MILCTMPFFLDTQSVHAHNSMNNNIENESFADPQQNVENESTENESGNNLGYVFAVFAIVWGLFFAFMILLIRKQTHISSEIASLKQLLKKRENP